MLSDDASDAARCSMRAAPLDAQTMERIRRKFNFAFFQISHLTYRVVFRTRPMVRDLLRSMSYLQICVVTLCHTYTNAVDPPQVPYPGSGYSLNLTSKKQDENPTTPLQRT
jgi:hypothetical protein